MIYVFIYILGMILTAILMGFVASYTGWIEECNTTGDSLLFVPWSLLWPMVWSIVILFFIVFVFGYIPYLFGIKFKSLLLKDNQ